jgi:hypothetical protein
MLSCKSYLSRNVPDYTICACCVGNIFFPKNKGYKENHLTKCVCPLPPYICQSCFDKNKGKDNTLCRFCQKPGSVVSGLFDPFGSLWYEPTSTMDWACKWLKVRSEYQYVGSPFCLNFLNNWNLCLFLKNCVAHGFFFPYYEPKLKNNFFQSWLQIQLFQKRGKVSVFYAKTMVNLDLLWMLKNVTFARVILRNFFVDYPLQGQSTKKLRDLVCARILANFATLFAISLNLK